MGGRGLTSEAVAVVPGTDGKERVLMAETLGVTQTVRVQLPATIQHIRQLHVYNWPDCRPVALAEGLALMEMAHCAVLFVEFCATDL